MVILAFILVLVLVFRINWQAFVPSLGTVDQQRLDSLAQVLTRDIPKNNRTLALDINTVTVDSLIAIGLSAKQAGIFVNYRKSIGGFASPDQIDNVYALSGALREKIKRLAVGWVPAKDTPRAILSTEEPGRSEKAAPWPKNGYKSVYKPTILTIDMNAATAQALEQLQGVGPVLAARIVKYRESLGGFVAESQLFEVYGLDSARVNLINVVLQVDTQLVKRLKVNELDATALAGHPYIDYKQANLLINYREHHGKYSSRKGILLSKAFTESELDALAPYLDFD